MVDSFDPSVVAQFEQYKTNHDRATLVFSSVTEMYEEENYNAIINMGVGVLPLIFKDLASGSNTFWFEALRRLTGTDVDRWNYKDAYDFDELVQLWLCKGKELGFL